MTTCPCTGIISSTLFGCINFQYSQTKYVPLLIVAKTSVYPCLTYNIHLYVQNVYCAQCTRTHNVYIQILGVLPTLLSCFTITHSMHRVHGKWVRVQRLLGHPVYLLTKSSEHFLFSQLQFEKLTLEVWQEGGGTDHNTKPITLQFIV